jgi:chromosome segregation ATPase
MGLLMRVDENKSERRRVKLPAGRSLARSQKSKSTGQGVLSNGVVKVIVLQQNTLSPSPQKTNEDQIKELQRLLRERDIVISNLRDTNQQQREKLELHDVAYFDYVHEINECKEHVEKTISEKVNTMRQKYAEAFQEKLIAEAGKWKALNTILLSRIKDMKKVGDQNDTLQSRIKDLKNSHSLEIHQLGKTHDASVLQLKDTICRLEKKIEENNKEIIALAAENSGQKKTNQETENKFQENLSKLAAKRKQCNALKKANENLESDVKAMHEKLLQLSWKQACYNEESKSENFPLRDEVLNARSSLMFFHTVFENDEMDNFGFPRLGDLESMSDDETIDLSNSHLIL